MSEAWGVQAARFLRGTTRCPRCGGSPIVDGRCRACGAVLSGPVADEVALLSRQAADLLDRRQAAIARLEVVAPAAAPALAGIAAALPPPTGAPRSTDFAPTPVSAATPTASGSGRISLQSVLAVAGAGLFAVAAIVFSYFNDDLTDTGTRRVVIGVVTALFLAGAWLLARRRLLLSAEAVGALGMVFVALDVAAVAEVAPVGASPWAFAAIGAAVAGVATIALGALIRLRTWLWSGALGLVLVPILVAAGSRGEYAGALGFGGAAVVALLLHELLDRVAPRFDSTLRADHVSLTVERLLAVAVAVAVLVVLVIDDPVGRALPAAGILAGLAVVAGFGARRDAGSAWSVLAGVLAVFAATLAPVALDLGTGWSSAATAAAGAAVLAVLALVPWPAALARARLWWGGSGALALVTLPQVIIALGAVVIAILRGLRSVGVDEDDAVLGSSLSLLAFAAALGAVAVGARRAGTRWTLPARAGGWVAVLGVLAVVAWPAWSRGGQVVVALAIAAAAVVALRVLGSRVPAVLRGPLFAVAHALVVFAAAVSWDDASVTVWAGAATVVAIGAVAAAVPAVLRPGYAVVGYAYALVVLARALDLAGLEAIPVICLTSTAASLAALGVTLLHRVRTAYWAGILLVTAVPFLLGLATVFGERTWWTAVATAAIFALSLTLTLSRRPGLVAPVRAIAAGLLVPSLSVVVVNVGPQLLETSGSPVTLPIIAAVVALVLPLSAVLARSLTRGGIGDATVAAVRIAIEVSSGVTALITVLLALVRPASGLDTALLVLVLLAVGFAATSVVGRRSYGWWAAGASLTGALWCVWGIVGVTAVEPFVFPPALAVAAVGVVLTLLGRNGAPLVGVGLAITVATSLTLLAVGGNGDDAVVPWRAIGLLTGAAVLTAAGAAVFRGERARRLRLPLLAVAIAAAGGGAVQAVRVGRALEAADGEPIWTALAWSVPAAVVGAAAGALLAAPTRGRDASRWLLAPAVAFAAAGPIAAVRPSAETMWALWGLTLALLALLVVTAVVGLRGPTVLPPAVAVFPIAWVTAVAGWSVRDLHVEWWSLPLGGALLLAGVLALRSGDPSGRASAASWPVGFRGSWWLLGPGIGVILLPSVLATGTNPATWRAILVIAIALAALLLGSVRRLAAPFILALVALAAEIAVVFLVQLGREIDALLWWITLATAGAVLLVIAVGFERRTGGDQGVAARMRDLR